MTVRNATPATFASVLDQSVSGDEIVMADGFYPGGGDLMQGRVNTDYITIRAANSRRAVFDGIFLSGSAYWRFVGMKMIDWSVGILNSHHIEIVDGEVNRATGNDSMQIMGDTHHVRVEGCTIWDNIATSQSAHPDLIQFMQDFGPQGLTPHDITIRRNHLYDNGGTGDIGAQGISISDGGPMGYRNILVEENLIACVLPNALMIQSGLENVILRRNTITQGRIWIINNQGLGNAGVTVEDNIATALVNDAGGAAVNHNLIAFPSEALVAYSDGSTVEQFRPKPEVLAAGYGALSWWGAPQPEPEPGPMPDIITLIAVTIDDPAMGTVSIENGQLRYAPAVDYSGSASGTYTIRDEAGQESTAVWSGTVSAPPNPPPLAVADSDAFTVPFGTGVVIVDVTANDFADAP